MFQELKKKQILLEKRRPYSSETGDYIRELNMLDWIHSSMRLDGCTLDRFETEKILKGGFVEDANINDHVLIERYCEMICAANDMAEMSYTLNKEMILTFQQKLTGDEGVGYRRENPVLVSLNYNPPHPSEIEEQMALMMNWFYSDDMELNPIRKAVCLHHRLIEIYPFDVYSEANARAAMYYFLMERGFPPFELDMKEQEYNGAVTEYLKRENPEVFYREAERCLFNKMDVLMQLTAR